MQTFFSNTFVINLDRRPDRLEHYDVEMNRLGLAYTRVPAIDGQALDEDFLDSVVLNPPDNLEIRRGRAGCNLSHIAALELAASKKLDPICVMEDDAVFASDFVPKCEQFFRNVPDDWDLVSLGYTIPAKATCGIENQLERAGEQVYRIRAVFSTHCYVIRLRVVEKFIRLIRESRKIIDVAWWPFLQTHRCYAPENLIEQRVDFSDIEQRPMNYYPTADSPTRGSLRAPKRRSFPR